MALRDYPDPAGTFVCRSLPEDILHHFGREYSFAGPGTDRDVAGPVYQFLFTEIPAAKIEPSYWINMGALAITALAGGSLMAADSKSALIHLLSPFVLGIAIASWAAASCWISWLLILGVWRHLIKRVKIAYSYQYWGMVFPLGMYTTCTFQVAKAANLAFLLVIPYFTVYAALVAWILTFIGLIHSLAILGFGGNTRDRFPNLSERCGRK